MKKIVLSLVAIATACSVAFADTSTDSNGYEDAPEDKGFYVGLAYSHLSHDIDLEGSSIKAELDFNGIMLDIGYKFNPYIALEGRYNVSISDELDDEADNADISVWSIYVKPMYPIAPEMDIYVLLGYSSIDASNASDQTSVDEGAFSWGAGALYDMTEDFAVFAEYTRFYDDTLNGYDHVVDSFNLGVSYKF